jgi:hypothetical protein
MGCIGSDRLPLETVPESRRTASRPSSRSSVTCGSEELHGHLTLRTVVVGVEAAVRPISATADSRPVVARLDLAAGRPLRLRDAVLPPPVHLSAVVKRWGSNGRGGAIGRSDGNGGRRSDRRECEHSCDEYRNESLLHGSLRPELAVTASRRALASVILGAYPQAGWAEPRRTARRRSRIRQRSRGGAESGL